MRSVGLTYASISTTCWSGMAIRMRRRLALRLHARPGVGVGVVDVRALLVALAADHDHHLMLLVPGGTTQRRGVWRRRRPVVAPGVRGQVIRPHGGVVEVIFAEPVPAV